MQLKVGKSLSIDGIPAEVYQQGGEAVLDMLQDLFKNCWEKGHSTAGPQGCSHCLSVQKQARKTRQFKLLRHHSALHCRQILARVLLNRLIPMTAQENTPESQCGFRSNRGTIDMIFMLRQIQEKCREQNMGLYTAFVDLTKAFDTVSHDGCGKSWHALAVPQNFSPSSASFMKVSKVR